jgi:hypothetical protein
MKNSVHNPGDDEFEEMSNEVDSMAQFSTYKSFDVDSKLETLSKDAKKMILSLCDLYLSKELISNEDYVKAIANVEAQNLTVLIKQVKYSEHILDSLMRQLDSGGYVDKSIYDTIREMQKSSIQITLEVSKYVRTLPEYFKFVHQDITKIKALDILNESTARTNIEASSKTLEEFNPAEPQRGTRNMMMDLRNVRKEMLDAMANAEEFEKINIDDTEDFEEDL